YLQAEIRIIYALPSHGKDYQEPYRQLKKALLSPAANSAYAAVHSSTGSPRPVALEPVRPECVERREYTIWWPHRQL
ncbi:MAG: hypothetical protein OEV08_14515, partial [Nitrospira sp.]|nr:hypothetical protein [Nitrospira sp.]